MNEPFEDVYVVTARTEATEKQATAIKEYVQVAESGIRVCINADSTEDSDAMCRALDMVADALDQLDGQYGTISFGDTLQFDLIAQ